MRDYMNVTIIRNNKNKPTHFVAVFDEIDKKTLNKIWINVWKNAVLEKKVWSKHNTECYEECAGSDGKVHGMDNITCGSHNFFVCGRTLAWDGWDEPTYVTKALITALQTEILNTVKGDVNLSIE